MSKISEHLAANNEETRLLSHGLALTADEIAFEYNSKHMRSIKVPFVFLALTEEDKKAAMDAMCDSAFDWTDEKLIALIQEIPAVKKLKLDKGDNLARMYKYVQAMLESITLGVGKPEDLVPNYERMEANRNSKLKAIIAARTDTQAPSRTDIGALTPIHAHICKLFHARALSARTFAQAHKRPRRIQQFRLTVVCFEAVAERA